MKNISVIQRVSTFKKIQGRTHACGTRRPHVSETFQLGSQVPSPCTSPHTSTYFPLLLTRHKILIQLYLFHFSAVSVKKLTPIFSSSPGELLDIKIFGQSYVTRIVPEILDCGQLFLKNQPAKVLPPRRSTYNCRSYQPPKRCGILARRLNISHEVWGQCK